MLTGLSVSVQSDPSSCNEGRQLIGNSEIAGKIASYGVGQPPQGTPSVGQSQGMLYTSVKIGPKAPVAVSTSQLRQCGGSAKHVNYL